MVGWVTSVRLMAAITPITSTEDTHQSHPLVTHHLIATNPSTTEDPQPHLSSVSLYGYNII